MIITFATVSFKLEEDPETEAKTHTCVKTEASTSVPVDWKPQEKCHFCVDGKLLKVNEKGELVVETGPVQPETELNKQVNCCDIFQSPFFTKFVFQVIESDDSSSSSDVTHKPLVKNHKQPPQSSHLSTKNFEAFLKTIVADPNMTSMESIAAAQIAAFRQLQPEMNPFFNPSECRVR